MGKVGRLLGPLKSIAESGRFVFREFLVSSICMYVNCIIMYSIKINGADYEDFAVINGYLLIGFFVIFYYQYKLAVVVATE